MLDSNLYAHTRPCTANLGIIPVLISSVCPLKFRELFSFQVEKLSQADGKEFGWRAGKRVGDGRSTTQLLAQTLSLIPTVSLALTCVWGRHLSAEAWFPPPKMCSDTVYLLPAVARPNTTSGKSQACIENEFPLCWPPLKPLQLRAIP